MSSSYNWTVLGLGFRECFCVYLQLFWSVSASAVDLLEKLDSEMTDNVSSGMLNLTQSVILSVCALPLAIINSGSPV